MKKKMYRITLMPNCNGLAETLAILAAKSNGHENKYSLEDLKNVAEGQKILYPSSNEGITCEVLSPNLLHLDRKILDSYETVLIIEQVEIIELDVPTLTRQDAQDLLDGIANHNNQELLN